MHSPLLTQAMDPTLSYKLIYGCNKADAVQEISLDPAVTVATLTHLLPQCEYWLEVGWRSGQALVLSDECNVTTPNGQSKELVPSFSPFPLLPASSFLFSPLPPLPLYLTFSEGGKEGRFEEKGEGREEEKGVKSLAELIGAK